VLVPHRKGALDNRTDVVIGERPAAADEAHRLGVGADAGGVSGIILGRRPPLMKRIASGSVQTRAKAPEYSLAQGSRRSRSVSAPSWAPSGRVMVRQSVTAEPPAGMRSRPRRTR